MATGVLICGRAGFAVSEGSAWLIFSRRFALSKQKQQNPHGGRGAAPPRIMKTGASRAGGTSGLYGVAYRSQSARRAPQMVTAKRLEAALRRRREFLRLNPRCFHGKMIVQAAPRLLALGTQIARRLHA